MNAYRWIWLEVIDSRAPDSVHLLRLDKLTCLRSEYWLGLKGKHPEKKTVVEPSSRVRHGWDTEAVKCERATEKQKIGSDEFETNSACLTTTISGGEEDESVKTVVTLKFAFAKKLPFECRAPSDKSFLDWRLYDLFGRSSKECKGFGGTVTIYSFAVHSSKDVVSYEERMIAFGTDWKQQLDFEFTDSSDRK